ncbi:MAG: Fe-S cluster assembly protein SufD [Thaumarchaeota archaeon]|nr:Fe-S cluster assembly protein SufD [Nitrososphaerota archaeon]
MARLALSSVGAEHVDGVSSSRREPGWLSALRRSALAAYKSLPLETSPLYAHYTDAKRMDPETVVLDTAEPSGVPAAARARLAELESAGTPYAALVGSRVEAIRVTGAAEAAGVRVAPIGEAISSCEGTVRPALESVDHAEDRFTALNTAAFDSGVVVHVPAGADAGGPIHLVSCLPEGGSSSIARNVIIAGESSRATVVQELYSPDGADGQAHMELLTSSVGAGARLDVTTLQMMGAGALNFSTRRARIERDATVNWYLGLFGTALSRYRIDYDLVGQGASVSDSEVAFGSGEQSFDIQACINHDAPSTEGRVTEKSILRGKSRSLFKGMIRIREGASKSSSYLSGRSILLDPDAKSDSIPGLEIATNDVKATHSASVAQIDEEQLFYLQARCMSRAEAERTIVEGFLEPLSRKMSYEVRAWIASLVESKWDGRELKINSDEELRKFIEVEETRYNENAEIEQHYKYR